MKNVAVLSHVSAQREQLLHLIEPQRDGIDGDGAGAPKFRHCVITRLADDTNIWVQASRNKDQDKQRGKVGNKKVTSVLGLCERLSLRSDSGIQTVHLIAPAQVLPKARCT